MKKHTILLTLSVATLLIGLSWGALQVAASNTMQLTQDRAVTVLSSASRTADTTSSDMVNNGPNMNVRGAYVTLDVTGITDTPNITLTVQIKDPASEKYESIMTASSGVAAAGTHTYLIYPGIGSAAGDVVQILSYPLPQVWRVSIDHQNTDAITYTVGALLIE